MKTFIASVCVCALVAMISCKKENESSTLRIHMTDAPVDVEEVNIDLLEVRVNFNKDTLAWIPLQTNAGVYNLLGLQNGIDSLIAEGTFPADQTVREVRLVVGSNNSVKVNGQVLPLVIPSGAETGLKIKINRKLDSAIENVLIDFDAALSLHEEVDGFKLRPVIILK